MSKYTFLFRTKKMTKRRKEIVKKRPEGEYTNSCIINEG